MALEAVQVPATHLDLHDGGREQALAELRATPDLPALFALLAGPLAADTV